MWNCRDTASSVLSESTRCLQHYKGANLQTFHDRIGIDRFDHFPLEQVLTTTINVAVGESTDKPPADRVVGNRCPSPRGSEQRSKYLVTDLLARIKLITNSLATGKRRSQAPHLSIAQHIHTDAEDKKKNPQHQKLRNWTGTTCCLRNNSNPVILYFS